MRRLFVAGLLYLTGIAVILLIKPQYMFREDGRWKEFGIGRDQRHFTHMPFWLFAVIWAILSYLLVSLLEDYFYGDSDIVVAPQQYNRNSRKNNQNTKPKELIPGYYMLNEGATGRNGVPRYVYLGPDEP
jgi:hypothetical protein